MAKTTTRRTDGISFRSFDDSWYSSVTGKYAPLRDEAGQKIKGKAGEPEARKAYYRLALTEGQQTTAAARNIPTVGQVCDDYLTFLKKNRAAKSYACAVETLTVFLKFIGHTRQADQIARHELKNWIASKDTWGSHAVCRGIALVVAAFNYAVECGELTVNQFAKFKKPVNQSRVVLLTDEQEQAIYATAKKGFADYVKFLILTGCRPDEAARIEASFITENAAGLQIVLSDHKTARKTGRKRVIYCNAEASQLVKEWVAINPQGAIFTRANGKPWDAKSREQNFARIRKTIQTAKGVEFFGDDLSLYACRHTYITRKLAAGVSIAVIAELCGNSPRMIETTYGHLNLVGNILWQAC